MLFLFWTPWGKSDKPICGSIASLHLINDNTRIPLISVGGKLFASSLTLWLPHPSSVWLWVMKMFRCAYYSTLGPSLAAGCCGLTRNVSGAVVLKPFLPDTVLKNVNKVEQTRLEWTVGLLRVSFWRFTFVLYLYLVHSYYVSLYF